MGMTIDEVEQWARQNNYTILTDNWWNAAQDTINKYQKLQADYENRLKADLVAVLTELQLEIEEKFNDIPFSYNHHQRTEFYRDIDEVIQQKINSLKEAKDGENND